MAQTFRAAAQQRHTFDFIQAKQTGILWNLNDCFCDDCGKAVLYLLAFYLVVFVVACKLLAWLEQSSVPQAEQYEGAELKAYWNTNGGTVAFFGFLIYSAGIG